MGEPEHKQAPSQDSHDLAIMLDPVLHAACDGQLSEIEWFKSAWQHGGAATGFAEWEFPDGRKTGVLVKLPIGPNEYRWTTLLGLCSAEQFFASHDLPTPRMLAGGTELGGYDLAWFVIERFPGSPVTPEFGRPDGARAVEELIDAAVEFHRRAGEIRPVDETPKAHDWDKLLHRARENSKHHGLTDEQRWNEAVKKVQHRLDWLLSKWDGRRIHTWCHGDLHPGNAMRRAGDSPARRGCTLLDLALVHPGHWIEDALYLERLYWGKVDLLHGVKPVSHMAKLRRERGLPCDDNYTELAMVRRVLMAACVPAFVEHEGHPKYTHAALELLEKTMPQLGH